MTQTKYEVAFRDGFRESSEWLSDDFYNDDDASDYLLKVQQDGHRDLKLIFWEKENGEWNVKDTYNEEECVQCGFLPQPNPLVKLRG